LRAGRSDETQRFAKKKNMVPENVRLVIWDLDETLWKGTLTEGGITEFPQVHRDIVVELAKRGILSSICSKNDFAAAKAVLVEQNLWDYFVFPSIDWSAKGPRIQRIVELAQLRPPTVTFVDDSPAVRAEALAAVPGLCVVDATGIHDLLRDPRFLGKNDANLSRLAHYKVLEAKNAGEALAGDDNLAFLRASDIRVSFDYRVEQHFDRVIELINRTNQLNFTKRRFPDDDGEAAAAISIELNPPWRQAALVRVADKYGDYGYVGFFSRTFGPDFANGRLLDFCFSCRTLGMGIEKFVYDALGKPEIEVVEPVVRSLFVPDEIDWVTLVTDLQTNEAVRPDFPEIRLRGGCELDAISSYCALRTSDCSRETSLMRSPFFVRKDITAHVLVPEVTREAPSWQALLRECGLEEADFRNDFLKPCRDGAILIYSAWGDIVPKYYRHHETGQIFAMDIPAFPCDLTLATDEHLATLDSEGRKRAERAIASLASHTEFLGGLSSELLLENLLDVFARFPANAYRCALEADEYWKSPDDPATSPRPEAVEYNRVLRQAAARHGIDLFNVADFVMAQGERLWTHHYHRIVYFRLAGAIMSRARGARSG